MHELFKKELSIDDQPTLDWQAVARHSRQRAMKRRRVIEGAAVALTAAGVLAAVTVAVQSASSSSSGDTLIAEPRQQSQPNPEATSAAPTPPTVQSLRWVLEGLSTNGREARVRVEDACTEPQVKVGETPDGAIQLSVFGVMPTGACAGSFTPQLLSVVLPRSVSPSDSLGSPCATSEEQVCQMLRAVGAGSSSSSTGS